LDMSHNPMLNVLLCTDNELSGEALNALFETLPEKRGNISISRNPGVNSCDPNIAINKGWSVDRN